MIVAVTTDHRFYRSPDGAVWTDSINSYDFWTRYLSVFDRVKVVARVEDVQRPGTFYRRADGSGVFFSPVPNYRGPWRFVFNARQTRTALRRGIDRSDAAILRVSSHLAGCVQPALVRVGHPYGLEVVNDPFDVFSPGAVRHRIRPLLRWWFTRQLGRQCRTAVAVAYVTERALQTRYPTDGFGIGVSDVQLSPDSVLGPDTGCRACAHEPERAAKGRAFRIVTVASLAQMYKAPDVLIRAVADCIRRGWNITLRIVGDGRHRAELECLARGLSIGAAVKFVGQVPAGAAIRNELDSADLFVLPSRCEGLPRAMVEAMARSLPCIGSTVGGIPELLSPEDLVVPGDSVGLAAKIREVLGSPARMSVMSARNFNRAQDFLGGALEQRWRAFLNHVRTATEEWNSAAQLTKSRETAEVVGGDDGTYSVGGA